MSQPDNLAEIKQKWDIIPFKDHESCKADIDFLVQRVEELEARLAKHANVPVPPASLPEKLSVEIHDDWNSEGD
jgi:hypothetical protein